MIVEEARKIIGPLYNEVPDELIQNMIDLFRLYSSLAISQHIIQKKKRIKDSSKLTKLP